MHSAMHFAIGAWVGTAIFLPEVIRRMKTGDRTAGALAELILLSYALGAWAIVPNIFRQAGLPEQICASPLMNIFLFHPLFDKINDGGMLIGEIAITACFLLQYSLILAGIKNAGKKTENGTLHQA